MTIKELYEYAVENGMENHMIAVAVKGNAEELNYDFPPHNRFEITATPYEIDYGVNYYYYDCDSHISIPAVWLNCNNFYIESSY